MNAFCISSIRWLRVRPELLPPKPLSRHREQGHHPTFGREVECRGTPENRHLQMSLLGKPGAPSRLTALQPRAPAGLIAGSA
jgi:hypothetical protein